MKYPCPGRTKGLQIRIQPIGCHHDLGRVDRPVPSESLLWASIQLRCNNALLCQKAIPIQVHLGHGEKGNMWRNCLEKSWVSRTVEHLTHLPCILADSQAISHCQKGWRNGFESGHVAVVQWILPISMACMKTSESCLLQVPWVGQGQHVSPVPSVQTAPQDW